MANKNMFSSFFKFSIFCLSLPLIFTSLQAETIQYEFNQKHQAGIRLGGWTNQGTTPDKIFSVSSLQFNSDIGSGSAYVEGYAAYRFTSYLVGELSGGVVNRGEVGVQFTNPPFPPESYFGNLMVYPILAKFRVYPFAGVNKNIYPYFLAGGGLYYMRHDIFSSGVNTSTITFVPEASKTKFNYVAGLGIDVPVTPVIGLDLQAEYFPIDFSEEFRGTSDWSALTITVGVKYLFKSSNPKDEKNGRRKSLRRDE